jgi:hypothetical protein
MASRRRIGRASASSIAKQPPTKLQAGGMVLQPRFVIPAYDGNAEVKGRPSSSATR